MYVIPTNNMLLMPSFPLSSFLRYFSPERNADRVQHELMETFLLKIVFTPIPTKALDRITYAASGRSEHILC